LDKISSYTLEPIGFIRSTVKRREEAPQQRPTIAWFKDPAGNILSVLEATT